MSAVIEMRGTRQTLTLAPSLRQISDVRVERPRRRHMAVITLSREMGSRGDDVARLVASAWGCGCSTGT